MIDLAGPMFTGGPPVGGIVPIHRRTRAEKSTRPAGATAARRSRPARYRREIPANRWCRYPHRCPGAVASRRSGFGRVRRSRPEAPGGGTGARHAFDDERTTSRLALRLAVHRRRGGAVVVILLFSKLINPSHLTPEKLQPYECGIPPVGNPWQPFAVRYFVFALLFLVFDVEAVFLFPWAIVFRSLGTAGFVEMLLFIAVLGFGLLYAWRKGALEWA